MSRYLFEQVSYLDSESQSIQRGSIVVDGSHIAAIYKDHDPSIGAGRENFTRVIDGSGKLLLPGFYNAHAHVPMTLLRGRGDNLPLHRWLNESIFPFEDHLDDTAAYWGTMVGIAEMLRFGTVSFSDMYSNSDARAQAVIESGIKCNLGHAVLSFDPDASYASLPAAAVNEHLLATFQGAADGRLVIDASLHAEYTSTPRLVRELAQWAALNNLRMHVHVSETQEEVEGCKQRQGGLTPVEYLAQCGLFDVPTTAAHCVWLTDTDRCILASKGVYVALNPASNAKLGSGICDVLALDRANVSMALGTDGPASNNNHDMLRSLYLMALFQRVVAQSAEAMPIPKMLSIATAGGALSQGRNDCGRIEVGCRADLVLLDLDTLWSSPCSDELAAVMYSAEGTDVVMTMVDGVVLYDNGDYPTIDIERALYEAKRCKQEILVTLGEA